MRTPIAGLLRDVATGKEAVRQQALVCISILLDLAAQRPGPTEALAEQLLTPELRSLVLSRTEVVEFVDAAINLMASRELSHADTIALFGIVTDHASVSHADVLLGLLGDFANSFSEQDAFSSLAVITDYLVRIETDIRITWYESKLTHRVGAV